MPDSAGLLVVLVDLALVLFAFGLISWWTRGKGRLRWWTLAADLLAVVAYVVWFVALR